jgi:putative lipoprotein
MRRASAAIAGMALALGACQPPDDAVVRERPGAEAERPEQRRGESVADTAGGREAPEAVATPQIGRTFVFDCDGDVSFTARFGPGEMALWAPESLGATYRVLSLARSGSGARYEEDDTVFENKGDLATIEIAGQRFVDCRSNPSKAPWADAKRRGATFRALGNEPAWYVEIFPERLVIVTELGTRRVDLVHGGPVVESGRTTYRAAADGRAASLIIDRRACADSMSGEGFEAAATVSFENRTLLGCGRFL